MTNMNIIKHLLEGGETLGGVWLTPLGPCSAKRVFHLKFHLKISTISNENAPISNENAFSDFYLKISTISNEISNETTFRLRVRT